MYIVECLPLLKSLNIESLSYFSLQHFEPGSLIKVPVRGKLKFALVLESKHAEEKKAEIRSANFMLRKIDSSWSNKFLTKEFLKATEKTAKYFATSSGSLLGHLLPKLILENSRILTSEKENIKDAQKRIRLSEVLTLQMENEDRISHYKALAREDFARHKSVFLCLPQNEMVLKIKEKINKGIEPYVASFSADMKKADFRLEYKKATNKKHPVLIIATPSWLFLKREDWGTVIIEEENARGWQTLSRPFVDLRFFVEELGKEMADRVIVGDSTLSISALWRYKEKSVYQFESVKWRLSSDVKTELIDTTKNSEKNTILESKGLQKNNKEKKEWKALSSRVIQKIKETLELQGNVFVYATRKGLSPIIICRDCGTRISCKNCESPIVLHKTRDQNIFKCHQCGETRDSRELCPNCKSWDLLALGAGTDKVADELRKNFPDTEKHKKIFELNSDIATTANKARGIADDFESGHSNILIGTEMALTFMRKKVYTTAIASIDSLFAIPDFQIRERVFQLITDMKSITRENLLVQTRNIEDQTLQLALSGNITDFYRMEIEDRKTLNYPPFSVFIKITTRGTKIFVTKETEKIKNTFKDWEPVIFSSVHEKKGKPWAVNAVLKIREEEFPDPNLLHLLLALPPHFEIKINPDNLL
ncbi:MAG: hypothetical protein AAB392_00210 [Patescibacteria group bacterium]